MENKPEKNGVPFSQYIISLICVAIISTGGTIIVWSKLFPVADAVSSDELSKVNTLYSEIMTNYVGKVSSDELVEGALKGMASALDDPYSVYVSKEESESLNSTISGSFEGIGSVMAVVDNYPTIMEEPADGTPSAKAGLKTGDIVEKVDGKSTEGKDITDVVKLIRGEKGTDVTLTIKRGEEVMEVPVTRDTITNVSVTSEIDKESPTVGKITISAFSNNTFEELKKEITTLRKDGATEFVIDLRGNPGGVLSQVEMMSSMFLEDGKTIVKFEDSKGQISETVASNKLDGGFKVTEPVVVLVDENSASASEVFASALQESAEVPIVGQTTYGKGTVQQVTPFGDESEIKLTVNKWLTPKGNWVNEKGVKPTVEVTYPDYYKATLIDSSTNYLEGNNSSAVKNIQLILSGLGYYNSEITTLFSPEMTSSVKQFQTDKGLDVTGVVDEVTGEALLTSLGDKVKDSDIVYNKGKESFKNQ